MFFVPLHLLVSLNFTHVWSLKLNHIKKSGLTLIEIGFVKLLKMTVYGHFGTAAETALKYTRDFSKVPFIICIYEQQI